MGWYKGTTAHLLRIAPHTVLTLVMNEGKYEIRFLCSDCRVTDSFLILFPLCLLDALFLLHTAYLVSFFDFCGIDTAVEESVVPKKLTPFSLSFFLSSLALFLFVLSSFFILLSLSISVGTRISKLDVASLQNQSRKSCNHRTSPIELSLTAFRKLYIDGALF